MDETAWIELYRDSVAPLYRHVSRRTGGDRQLAEDVTQEAWLRALASWRKQGAPRDPAAWLRTVAANLLRNHFRRRRPQALSGEALDLESEDLGVLEPQGAALLHWGLARLKSDEASLIEARHLDGTPLAQLAADRGVSERAIEGRLRRARAALAAVLGPRLQREET